MRRKATTFLVLGLAIGLSMMMGCGSAEDIAELLKDDPAFLAEVEGDPGEPGAPGQSIIGPAGPSCWDTDGNGIGDPQEDINGDGEFDVLDCQGGVTVHGELAGLGGDDHPQYVIHGEADAITEAMLESGSVTDSKIASVSPGKIIPQGDGSGLDADTLDGFEAAELMNGNDGGGDITAVMAGIGLTGGGESGSVTISVGTEAITSDHLANNSVTSSEIANGAVTLSKISTAGPATGQVISYDGSAVVWDTPAASAPRVEFAELDDGPQLSTSWQSDVQVTIVAPSSGTVHVIANASVDIGPNSGLSLVGISDSPTGPPLNVAQRASFTDPNLGADIPVTSQHRQTVESGSYTFYLVGRIFIAGDDITLRKAQISVTFFPV